MKPKDNKASATGKKVFDVSRPGKTPAQPGTRPVITNRKTIDDPDISSKRPLMNPKQKVVVKSPKTSVEQKTQANQPQPKAQPAAKPQTDSTAINVRTSSAKEGKPQPKKSELSDADAQPPRNEPSESASNLQEAPSDQPSATAQPKPAKPIPEKPIGPTPEPNEPARYKPEPSRNEQVEPMHMGMTGELGANPPARGRAVVSQHKKRRTLWLEILAVLLILALLAAIANLLLDAEIIKTNLDIPHTDFFKQI